MRTRFPEGSRKAQSRTPHGWDAGSCNTSAPDARTFSKVASRSSERKIAACNDPWVTSDRRASPSVRLGQDDVEVLPGGADGHPAELARLDVVADLETERVAVEAERGLGVVNGDEHC